MTRGWSEVADGVHVGRVSEWDVSIGVVLGTNRCLVIDTGAGERQGGDLAAAVRALTSLPWTVVLTHHHFDHCRGLSVFLPCETWAHERCPERMRTATPDAVLPNRLLREHAEIDLGGRRVELRHFGPAHTDNDVVAHVPDAGVLFAGDLVEHVPGGSFSAESFEETDGLEHWPGVLDTLLSLEPTVVVPGHGDPVGPGFVSAVRASLATLAGLRRDRDAGVLTAAQAQQRSPFPHEVTAAALR